MYLFVMSYCNREAPSKRCYKARFLQQPNCVVRRRAQKKKKKNRLVFAYCFFLMGNCLIPVGFLSRVSKVAIVFAARLYGSNKLRWSNQFTPYFSFISPIYRTLEILNTVLESHVAQIKHSKL